MTTDNNRVNQNLFSLLAPNGTYCIRNPKYPDRVIRLIYDTIHILKNFRNNWINKKDPEKSFFYPKFDNFSIIQQAAFKDIRDLYHSEKLKMIKSAPKLNAKTIHPNKFERQKVPLVLNLIHPTTIAALNCKEFTDTAEFLDVIRIWFDIVNNRSTVMGINREEWNEHQIFSDCFKINFLKKFVDWLEFWKDLELDLHIGGLTRDTFTASISATEGLIKLIGESFISTDIEVFLCGNFQTNDLEKRFGRYRQLSGCNYNVSVKQILESEKKLRIKNIISTMPHELNSAKYTVQKSNAVDVTTFLDLLDEDYIEAFTEYDHSSFLYVCGYGGHVLAQKLSCPLCRDLIIKSHGTFSGVEYFDIIQEGGLIVPTELCLILLLHMYAIFNFLRTDEEKRRAFQLSKSPRSLLVLLTLEGISRNTASFPVDWNDKCICGTSYEDLFIPLLSIYANIILNNYRKKINDLITVRKLNASKEKKRKREANEKTNTEPKIPKNDERAKPNRKALIYKKL